MDCGRFSPRRPRRPRARRISPASPIRSIDALIEQIIAAPTPARAHHRLQGARPRVPRRPLLDSALVQAVALDRVLGRVRPARDKTALRSRHSGDLVVRPRQGGENRERWVASCEREIDPRMAAYILRRLLFMIPTLFGIMLVSFVVVQFAPGGPVERVIAAAHRGRHRRRLAHLRLVERRFRRARARSAAPGSTRPIRNTAARRASIRNSSRAWRSSSASTSRPTSASS